MLVDPVSARDPSLAPPGRATVTLTLGAIPAQLFDGTWTDEKRELLLSRALARLAPLGLPRVLAAATIVPPDIEAALGLTGGDLDGGAAPGLRRNGRTRHGGDGSHGLARAGHGCAAGGW
jgi:phytoene dehydrogenase-like protein